MINSYAELKRNLTVGRQLRLVYSSIENHKYLNTVREIIKIQTNGVKFEGGSWLGLGMYGEKADNFTYFENGFSVIEDGKEFLKYEFVN